MQNWLIIAVPLGHTWVGKRCQGGRRKSVTVISAQGRLDDGSIAFGVFSHQSCCSHIRRRECRSLL